MDKPANPWSVLVAVEDIPETGLHMEIEAPAAARAGVAALADLRDLPRLSATFDLTRKGAGAHVSGEVRALVGQTCVVSLEPMESQIEETVDVRFVPAAAAAQPAEGHHVAPGKEEPAEPLKDGKLDLGALATEFLLLGIDPYPRKPGAEFASPKAEEAGERPFAALAALKKQPGGGQS